MNDPADTPLARALGHLGAALAQALPSDDPIIIDHVRAAHDLLEPLRRAEFQAWLNGDAKTCPRCCETEAAPASATGPELKRARVDGDGFAVVGAERVNE